MQSLHPTLAFLVGVPIGAVTLLTIGPLLRILRYIPYIPFRPFTTILAMIKANYRGLMLNSFWWVIAGLAFVRLFVLSNTPAAIWGFNGAVVGVVAARIGYGAWDRRHQALVASAHLRGVPTGRPMPTRGTLRVVFCLVLGVVALNVAGVMYALGLSRDTSSFEVWLFVILRVPLPVVYLVAAAGVLMGNPEFRRLLTVLFALSLVLGFPLGLVLGFPLGLAGWNRWELALRVATMAVQTATLVLLWRRPSARLVRGMGRP